MSIAHATGYDGREIRVSDRVRLHPDCSGGFGGLFGKIVGMVPTPEDRLRIVLDNGLSVCAAEESVCLSAEDDEILICEACGGRIAAAHASRISRPMSGETSPDDE